MSTPIDIQEVFPGLTLIDDERKPGCYSTYNCQVCGRTDTVLGDPIRHLKLWICRKCRKKRADREVAHMHKCQKYRKQVEQPTLFGD